MGLEFCSTLLQKTQVDNLIDPTVFLNPYNAKLFSKSGPVVISRPDINIYLKRVNNLVLESYAKIGIKTILENYGPEILGASRPHFRFANGRRAEAYLRPTKDRPNLFVTKYARATEVFISCYKTRK